MPWVVRQGVELWLLGVTCLLVSASSLPGMAFVRVAADTCGLGGLALVTFGVFRLAHADATSARPPRAGV